MTGFRIQSCCRRCGGGRLAAPVVAWAEFAGGELRAIDLADPQQDLLPLKRSHALCLDCMEAQPVAVEAEELAT